LAYDKKAGKRKRLAREEENRQLKRYKSECRELDTYFMSEDELIQAKERQRITKIKNKAIVQRAYMIAMATN
jgi:hypothetical protein